MCMPLAAIFSRTMEALSWIWWVCRPQRSIWAASCSSETKPKASSAQARAVKQTLVEGIPDAEGGDYVLGQVVQVDRFDGLRRRVEPAAVGQAHVLAVTIFDILGQGDTQVKLGAAFQRGLAFSGGRVALCGERVAPMEQARVPDQVALNALVDAQEGARRSITARSKGALWRTTGTSGWASKKASSASRGTKKPRWPSKAAPSTYAGVSQGCCSSIRVVSLSKLNAVVKTWPVAGFQGTKG